MANNHKNLLHNYQLCSLKYFTIVLYLVAFTLQIVVSVGADGDGESVWRGRGRGQWQEQWQTQTQTQEQRQAQVQAQAKLLLKFKASLTNADVALPDWVAGDSFVGPLCTGNTSEWTGLTCMNGRLRGLRLEGMGLGGSVDVETLAQMPRGGIRSLSLANNTFEGPVPPVKSLARLRVLYLSGNRFSGEIPGDGFEGMKFLTKLHLERNQIVGKLPESLAKLENLVELSVEGNGFQGKIPGFPKRDWKFLSFADNHFFGPIPASLSKVDQTAFLGNKDLCGEPLGPCKSSKKPTVIVVIAFSAATLICAIALIAFLRASRAKAQISETKLGPQTKVYKRFTFRDKAHESSEGLNDTKNNNKGRNGNLHFVRNDGERFELEDMLRASAEVLGSGSFGSSYKALLFTGSALVVKRFRYLNSVGREVFQAHMGRLGRLAHPNVLSIVAFYYTKEEKLLISPFVENGSLASHLHGNRAKGQLGLDWATRLKIIKGVSRGMSYLYKEFPDLSLPHGHLKSSNILLDRNLKPLLSEYALAPLISNDNARRFMAAHKSPESSNRHRVSKKTDVWSLGILILELLTGKFPTNYMAPMNNERGAGDLVAWVKSVVREEWTGELFDKEMGGTKRGEGQMYKLLKIGMCCCETSPDRRWDLQLVVDRIDELRESNNAGEETDYSSYVTDWDVYSSMMLSDEIDPINKKV